VGFRQFSVLSFFKVAARIAYNNVSYMRLFRTVALDYKGRLLFQEVGNAQRTGFTTDLVIWSKIHSANFMSLRNVYKF